jgi:hypothetical protein
VTEYFQKQLDHLEDQIGAVKKVISAPGNILNAACSGIGSALSASGDWFRFLRVTNKITFPKLS